MGKCFCDICNKKINYGIADRNREVLVRGQVMTVTYKAKICTSCGEELYDDALELQILRNAQQLYREQHKMLPASALLAYMREHKLSAEQMAEKVGCAVGLILRAQSDALVDEKVDAAIKAVVA